MKDRNVYINEKNGEETDSTTDKISVKSHYLGQ